MQVLKIHFSTSSLLRIMSRKLNYPSADRNKAPILEVLQKHIGNTADGRVLEIASGTGQHLAHFAPHFPRLFFQPTEVDPSLFASIDAHAEGVATRNVGRALRLDVGGRGANDHARGVATDNVGGGGANDYARGVATDNVGGGGAYDYALCVNMIHVTPFACAEGLFRVVGGALRPGGLLFTYGPYADHGVLEPQSNRDFDRQLRARDPECGVKDIRDLIRVAEPCGMRLAQTYNLPANNKCLVWEKLGNA